MHRVVFNLTSLLLIVYLATAVSHNAGAALLFWGGLATMFAWSKSKRY